MQRGEVGDDGDLEGSEKGWVRGGRESELECVGAVVGGYFWKVKSIRSVKGKRAKR